MKYLLLSIFALITSAPFGQIPGYTEPHIKLACPESLVFAGSSFEVTVTAEPKLTEKQAAVVTYNWTVSWGTIAKGAGTDMIT